jgi:O-antigen biosynthesis protein WbqP
MVKRVFDITLAFVALPVALPVMAVCALLIKATSKGPILFWSDRIGIDNTIFKMPKFRTMKLGAPVVATHKLTNPQAHVTTIGRVLRKTSLDELPQLYSIMIGDISWVGPRPALFNQDDLVALRTEKGVHRLTPGLTGWAQINGRDELTIPDKVQADEYYLQHRSFWFDVKILFLTLFYVVFGRGVSH